MGITPILLLPYPELNDPANVPTDMRELAEAIELVIGGALPSPVTRYLATTQTITVTDAANEQAFNPVATLRNPHTKLYLLAEVLLSGWCDATPGTAYLSVKSSGQTAVATSSGARVPGVYRDFAAMATVTIAPGATATLQLKGHKFAASDVVTVAFVRNTITPVGWLKTGVIS